MAGAEIHGRRHTQLEVGVEAELTQHAHVEPRVPAVLVAGDDALLGGAVFQGDDLRPHVHKLDVLQVRTYQHTEVKRPEVDIGLVFYLALLGKQ